MEHADIPSAHRQAHAPGTLQARTTLELQTLIRAYLAQLRVVRRQCTERRTRQQVAELRRLENVIEQRVDKSSAATTAAATAATWEELAFRAEYQLPRLATLHGVSLRQLQRIFKQTFSCCPRRWLRDLRCRKAKELIRRGYSTKAAAAEVKFATEAHFCREFKKVFGVPPRHFAPIRPPLLPPLA